MAATIGALRVVLGADTAAFEKGLKGAETRLSGFKKSINIAGAAIGAAIGTAVVALGVAVKKTIDRADELSKLSQKIGIPVEELSRLAHAADLSGVSVEGLATSVVRLSRNMSDVARGAGEDAADAFNALGIRTQDAEGNLRDVNQVLGEVADRFAGMEDGAEKTAIAVRLLGRSGAELIPLLNEGAAGIQELKDEADKLGIVFDERAAKAAEQFNDNLTRLQRVGDGLVVSIVNNITPGLADLSDALVSTSTAAADLADKFGEVALSAAAMAGQRENASTFFEIVKKAALDSVPVLGTVLQTLRFIRDAVSEVAGTAAGVSISGGVSSGVGTGAAANGELAYDDTQVQAAADAAAEAQRELNASLAEGASIYEQTRTPLEAYHNSLLRLQELQAMGAIDADTFGRAQMQALGMVSGAYGQMALDATGALQTIFGDHKELAMAEAAINTAMAITQALGAYPPPLSFAMAALQGAAGAAQIAAISAQEFHQGGVVGVDTGRMRNINSGLRYDEYPAVLQKGEGVFTKEQMAAMGGDTFNIEINAPGADASTVGFFRSPAFRFAVTAAVKDAQSRRRL